MAWHPDWRDRAACIGEDPELFFPIGTGAQSEQQVDDAKQICADCPVIRQCRSFAIVHGYEGVWGGLDEVERRRLRRRLVTPVHLVLDVPDTQPTKRGRRART